jgi:hypothetical protein
VTIQASVAVIAALFAGMGVFALVWPARLLGLFGTPELTLAGRNEVRAVYGGFGLAAASALLWALLSPRLAPGIYFALGLALWGMAAGRILSALIDKKSEPLSWLIFAVELVAGGVLILANLRSH